MQTKIIKNKFVNNENWEKYKPKNFSELIKGFKK